MIILWTCLITATTAQKVFESTEDIGPEAFQNVTTLYPINNNKTTNIVTLNNETNEEKENNETSFNDQKGKLDATVWKIDAAFAESDLDKQEQENSTDSEEKSVKENATKEFKPSPHLGSFYDEDSLRVTPTTASFTPFTPAKKPSSGLVSSLKDEYRTSFTKIPKTMLHTHKQYPYKFESPILTRVKDHWRFERPDSLQSRPTVEVPVKVPAGGFYKYEDPFKEKPGKWDEDFGLGFNEDGKDIEVHKRVNPWENFIRMVTAFLPVGLIISALTPSIISIENSHPGVQGNTYPSNIFRRSDHGLAELPTISERCRRRLLCELHSENHYKPAQKAPHQHGKQCYKIHCEDTEALARTLHWLLEYKHLKGHYN